MAADRSDGTPAGTQAGTPAAGTSGEPPFAENIAENIAEDIGEGFAAAAILAAGVGCLALGVLTTLSEASEPVHDALEWSKAVGPLAGKTGLSVIIWLMAWAVLYGLSRGKPMSVKRVLPLSLVLIGLGVLGTFPIFFQLFAAG